MKVIQKHTCRLHVDMTNINDVHEALFFLSDEVYIPDNDENTRQMGATLLHTTYGMAWETSLQIIEKMVLDFETKEGQKAFLEKSITDHIKVFDLKDKPVLTNSIYSMLQGFHFLRDDIDFVVE